MRASKINYFVVGAFILLMIAGLIFAIITLSGNTGATDAYRTHYKNVTGIKPGAQVLYEGYPIGQVEKVTPEPANGRMIFRVDFSVIQDWDIPSDSIAQISSSGLLSAITINIKAGESTQPIEPGGVIEGQESADLFAAVSSVASEIGSIAERDIRPLLQNIGEAVDILARLLREDGQSLAKDSREMVSGLKVLVEDLSKSAPGVIDNIEMSSENFSALSQDLQATRERLDQLLLAMNDMVVDNKSAVEQSVEDLRYVIDSVARHVDSVNQNMEGTARNMYEFSRQIRQNPGLLLGGTPPKDAAAK